MRTDETTFSHQPGPELRVRAGYGQIHREQRETLQHGFDKGRAPRTNVRVRCAVYTVE